MIAAFVLFAMYGSSFLPLVVLSLARVGKTEIWTLTGLTVLWLGGMAWLHGQLYETEMENQDLPWMIAGVCAGVCLLWAAFLSFLKRGPNQQRRTVRVTRP